MDALGDPSPLAPFMGKPRGKLHPVGRADAALITHLHLDHCDPITLRESVDGGLVGCPPTAQRKVEEVGLRPLCTAPWEPKELAGFRCTAVPAVDGVGLDQISWVIVEGATRVLHCGDTLWHGYWWQISREHGPFAAVFLPVNGAIARFPGMTPSEVPAALTPDQAAAAAAVLGASLAVPIHYGLFHEPPAYESIPDAERQFVSAARARGVETRVLEPGETLDL